MISAIIQKRKGQSCNDYSIFCRKVTAQELQPVSLTSRQDFVLALRILIFIAFSLEKLI